LVVVDWPTPPRAQADCFVLILLDDAARGATPYETVFATGMNPFAACG